MGNWFYRFMAGRYGMDKLNIALIGVWIAFGVINLFFHSIILYSVGLLFAAVCLVRVLSRNVTQRSHENAVFEKFFGRFSGFWKLQSLKIKQFKTHRFFKCPYCRATIRIPKRRGEFTVRCTRCGKEFRKKLWL